MSKGLQYFQKIYDVVPGWIQKMHDNSPEMLDYYTDIRGQAFKGAALTAKEKDVLVAVMNAGRLYSRSMLYHTKGAVTGGITLSELTEYFLVAYLYKGEEALRVSLEAIVYALELMGKNVQYSIKGSESIEDILNLVLQWTRDEELDYLNEVLELIKKKDLNKVEGKILQDGNVSAKLKNLALIGCFITELDGVGAKIWIERARELGTEEKELADLGYICILTAGIPAWFEISDSLK